MKKDYHGGDLEIIEKKCGLSKNQLIDFAGNTNPLGPPDSLLFSLQQNIREVAYYPDKEYSLLRSAISSYVQIPKEYIGVANGATQFISAGIQCVKPKKTLLVSPSYSEYEKVLKAAGSAICIHPLKEEHQFVLQTEELLKDLQQDVDLLILTSPNNPTGRAISKKQMEIILKHCKRQRIFVMVDETYVEFERENISLIECCQDHEQLMVIRGISKFFKAPGLRLGYALASPFFMEPMKSFMDPWSVSNLASFAAPALFLDHSFIERSKQWLQTQKEIMYQALDQMRGIIYYPSDCNFILLRFLHEKHTASAAFDYFLQHRMLIRNASSFLNLGNNYIRVSIHTEENNQKFLHLLKKFLT